MIPMDVQLQRNSGSCNDYYTPEICGYVQTIEPALLLVCQPLTRPNFLIYHQSTCKRFVLEPSQMLMT